MAKYKTEKELKERLKKIEARLKKLEEKKSKAILEAFK